MPRWPKPLVVAALRRRPGEIARRAAGFAITGDAGRRLVSGLGEAFVSGFNAMLAASDLAEVAAAGERVEPHFRPFFFEGAAMGYLPRGYHDPARTPQRAESDLLGLDARFRYLYYVGLGFWIAMRHPRRPERLERLAPHVDPLSFPLCHDGFGFKVGFFDYPRRPASVATLQRCPPSAYQGFGRALFFVYMDDPGGFERAAARVPAERRADLELGRALACGFTGIDRPAGFGAWAAEPADERLRAARRCGLTWALTARALADPAYFERCLQRAGADANWLRRLPALCDEALRDAPSYEVWQRRTRERTREVFRTAVSGTG